MFTVLFVNGLLRDSWAAIACSYGAKGFVSRDEYEGREEIHCEFCGSHVRIVPDCPTSPK